MKSHVVSVRFVSRVSVIYKAMPKGYVTRRICEAVSGSTDLWDGSRAVVASCREAKRKTVSSEHALDDVDMGKLVIPVEATKWPARSLSGNPASC